MGEHATLTDVLRALTADDLKRLLLFGINVVYREYLNDETINVVAASEAPLYYENDDAVYVTLRHDDDVGNGYCIPVEVVARWLQGEGVDG